MLRILLILFDFRIIQNYLELELLILKLFRIQNNDLNNKL